MGYKPSREELWVIAMALAFLVVAVLATSIMTGMLSFSGDGGGDSDYKNITATDALLACKSQTRSQFSKGLKRQIIDDHSSRYDAYTGQFKVFIKAEIGGSFNTPDTSFYVSCFVSSRSGRVVDYDVFEDKEEKSRVIRKNDTNLFGWPPKKD